jgi:hypothetical protein
MDSKFARGGFAGCGDAEIEAWLRSLENESDDGTSDLQDKYKEVCRGAEEALLLAGNNKEAGDWYGGRLGEVMQATAGACRSPGTWIGGRLVESMVDAVEKVCLLPMDALVIGGCVAGAAAVFRIVRWQVTRVWEVVQFRRVDVAVEVIVKNMIGYVAYCSARAGMSLLARLWQIMGSNDRLPTTRAREIAENAIRIVRGTFCVCVVCVRFFLFCVSCACLLQGLRMRGTSKRQGRFFCRW